MIVSLEAIFLTLFVLTSQNRQRARDRIRSDIEFESSINTETKIAYLHEKIDKLTEGHYALLVNTQKLLEPRPGTGNLRPPSSVPAPNPPIPRERKRAPKLSSQHGPEKLHHLGTHRIARQPALPGRDDLWNAMGLGRR